MPGPIRGPYAGPRQTNLGRQQQLGDLSPFASLGSSSSGSPAPSFTYSGAMPSFGQTAGPSVGVGGPTGSPSGALSATFQPLTDYWSRLNSLLSASASQASQSSQYRISASAASKSDPIGDCRRKGGVWVIANPFTREPAHCQKNVSRCIGGIQYICNAEGTGQCVKTSPEQPCAPARFPPLPGTVGVT